MKKQLDPKYLTQEYIDWKNQLIYITAKETKQEEWRISINDESAYPWYESGTDPYYCFRETW